ncbi:MAG: hypothetical protein QXW41_07360 [Fervidicoccaceae archaeon]
MTEEAVVYEEMSAPEIVVVVPDRIASLIYSFVDSSMKKKEEYYWNKMFMKILRNGDYWLVGVYVVKKGGEVLHYAPFVRFSSDNFLEIIYEPESIRFAASFALERRVFKMEEARSVVVKGIGKERKVALYEIIAKLLRYYFRLQRELNI